MTSSMLIKNEVENANSNSYIVNHYSVKKFHFTSTLQFMRWVGSQYYSKQNFICSVLSTKELKVIIIYFFVIVAKAILQLHISNDLALCKWSKHTLV